jgi:hypothetical protein
MGATTTRQEYKTSGLVDTRRRPTSGVEDRRRRVEWSIGHEVVPAGPLAESFATPLPSRPFATSHLAATATRSHGDGGGAAGHGQPPKRRRRGGASAAPA